MLRTLGAANCGRLSSALVGLTFVRGSSIQLHLFDQSSVAVDRDVAAAVVSKPPNSLNRLVRSAGRLADQNAIAPGGEDSIIFHAEFLEPTAAVDSISATRLAASGGLWSTRSTQPPAAVTVSAATTHARAHSRANFASKRSHKDVVGSRLVQIKLAQSASGKL